MSNPESEIQQGATVLNISSVCPKCGEVFCKEHNVYGLAVKQLTDEIERVRKERGDAVSCVHRSSAEIVRLETDVAVLKADTSEIESLNKELGESLIAANIQRDARCEQLEAKFAEMRACGKEIVDAADADMKRWGTYHGLEAGEQRLFNAITNMQKLLSSDCGTGFVNVRELDKTIKLLQHVTWHYLVKGEAWTQLYRELARLEALQKGAE